MSAVVEARDLHFAYGGSLVLEGVDFAVNRGDFAAIVGANGAGKSTLLHLLLGELEASRGSVSLFGQEVRRFRDWTRIGYVPQNGIAAMGKFPASVQEVVEANLRARFGFLRSLGWEGQHRIQEALARVGMEDHAGDLVGEVSGGQLQRVLIARALVGDCDLMVLDEPVTGIDSESAAGLYGLLTRLNREQKMTIVMVTHDMARCARFVSRVFCLEEGSLVELEPDQIQLELHHRHKHPKHGKGNDQ